MLHLATDLSDAAAAPPALSITPFVQPERVILDNTVYVYDHCPFCVRVRLALGIKNVKHKLHFLANDDVATPTNLVGKKIAPIFVSVHSDDSAEVESS
jgi:glutaredoxin 2